MTSVIKMMLSIKLNMTLTKLWKALTKHEDLCRDLSKDFTISEPSNWMTNAWVMSQLLKLKISILRWPKEALVSSELLMISINYPIWLISTVFLMMLSMIYFHSVVKELVHLPMFLRICLPISSKSLLLLMISLKPSKKMLSLRKPLMRIYLLSRNWLERMLELWWELS